MKCYKCGNELEQNVLHECPFGAPVMWTDMPDAPSAGEPSMPFPHVREALHDALYWVRQTEHEDFIWKKLSEALEGQVAELRRQVLEEAAQIADREQLAYETNLPYGSWGSRSKLNDIHGALACKAVAAAIRARLRLRRKMQMRLRNFCSQCGQRLTQRACGPTHALLWWKQLQRKRKLRERQPSTKQEGTDRT